jgi:hypothetical protein
MFQPLPSRGVDPETASERRPVLVLSPSVAIRLLSAAIAILFVFQLAALALRYTTPDFALRDTFIHAFSFDEEANVPTWYSSSVLLVCSGLLALIAYSTRRAHGRFARHWAMLAVIFLALSVDEEAALHEGAIRLRETFRVGGVFYYAWVIPGLIFVTVVAVAFLRFVLSLPRRTRVLFIASAAVFVSGALGFEMIGGARAEIYGKDNLVQDLLTTVEELFEMAGAALFVYALLDYIRRHVGPVQIRAGDERVVPS